MRQSKRSMTIGGYAPFCRYSMQEMSSSSAAGSAVKKVRVSTAAPTAVPQASQQQSQPSPAQLSPALLCSAQPSPAQLCLALMPALSKTA